MGAPPQPPGAPPGEPPSMPPGVTESEEHSLIGNRAIRFLTRHVNPPSALYVTADDGLYVAAANALTGTNLTLAATMLLPDGRVQASTWNIAVPAGGALTPLLFPLTESFLMNVSVMPPATLRYGSTWLFVAVRRGGLASGVNLQTLISDYVDTYGGPTWPGARIVHSIEGPGLIFQNYYGLLATGTNVTVTVPAYGRVLMRSVFAQLQTSATVGNRQVFLDFLDPSGNIMYRDMTENTVAATAALGYSWGDKLGTAQAAPQLNYLARSLPEVYLIPGSSMLISAANFQANDQWNKVCVNYEFWFSL